MRRSLILLPSLFFVISCGGSSTPTTPSKPSAVVEINSPTATGATWNNGHQYTIRFNLIERGGVPIVIDRLGGEVYAGNQLLQSFTWNVSGVFGSNRMSASSNRYATLTAATHPGNLCGNASSCADNETHATRIVMTVNWNDDNQHAGATVSTVTVPTF